MARIAIGVSVALGLLTALLVFGGQTLERFNLRGGAGTALLTDYRWLIFRDAWDLIRASPAVGIGLGNFQPVFAIFRDASFGQSQALHPESDWLWLCAEVGWPAVLLAVIGAGFLIRQVFPLGEGTNQWFRVAALIAAVLFALHGLVDVAGHRVGSAYAGIFLIGLALRRPMRWAASRWLTNGFRAVGLLLVGVGLTWVVAAYAGISVPGSIGVDRERHLAASANVGRLHNDTIRHATKALEWAPLDWQLYFLRALGQLGAQRPPAEALADFRRARFLEPNSYEVPYQEGVAWITSHPTLAMTAWREALRRAGSERPPLFERMLSAASHLNPAVSRMLEEFGGTQADLALTFLERAQGGAFMPALDRLLKQDAALQKLDEVGKRKVFALGVNEETQSSSPHSSRNIRNRSSWRGAAWRNIVRRSATSPGAVELARQFSARPVLPQATTGSSTEELQRNLFADPSSYGVGFALYQQQMQEGKTEMH
jgi:hypothetical protein